MRTPRSVAILLAAAVSAAPLAACQDTHTTDRRPPPAVDDTRPGGYAQREAPAPTPAPTESHWSTGKKTAVVLAGAAALYYLYKKHQTGTHANAIGADGTYYLSRNGRVYYRDADHRAHWVTPPPGGITVPAAEAAEYRGLQGYDNNPNGKDLTDIVAQAEPYPTN
jgi:hypothetical protein